ncbi:hypothetical protein ACUXPF_003324 [Sphingomonas sanguinis]|jgi:hypothetical protein
MRQVGWPMAASLAGLSGIAALPAPALDPPHRAASPAVPALSGPGPHQTSSRNFFGVSNFLELAQYVGMNLGKVTQHGSVIEQL